jgi:uncharacterized membrane protein
MNNIESFLKVMLWAHIAGGTTALLTGLGAMLSAKGGRTHRTFGKIYFWSMTTVFASAVVLAIGHSKTFLLMVAFFSYYFTVRGYRILFQKGLGRTTSATWVDVLIGVVAGTFIVSLGTWGVWIFLQGDSMGIVAIVFCSIGATFLIGDIRKFRSVPERMHWWKGQIAAMGGSYISAVTAFVVVNITLPSFGWTLWILPSVVGGTLIGRTIRKYKVKFEMKEAV